MITELKVTKNTFAFDISGAQSFGFTYVKITAKDSKACLWPLPTCPGLPTPPHA